MIKNFCDRISVISEIRLIDDYRRFDVYSVTWTFNVLIGSFLN